MRLNVLNVPNVDPDGISYQSALANAGRPFNDHSTTIRRPFDDLSISTTQLKLDDQSKYIYTRLPFHRPRFSPFPIMSSQNSSGSTSPLSSTATLASPNSPRFKYSNPDIRENVFKGPINASSFIEFIPSRSVSTSAVYIYDLALQAGFGT